MLVDIQHHYDRVKHGAFIPAIGLQVPTNARWIRHPTLMSMAFSKFATPMIQRGECDEHVVKYMTLLTRCLLAQGEEGQPTVKMYSYYYIH